MLVSKVSQLGQVGQANRLARSIKLVSSVGYVVSSIGQLEELLTRPSKQCKSLIDVLIQRQ